MRPSFLSQVQHDRDRRSEGAIYSHVHEKALAIRGDGVLVLVGTGQRSLRRVDQKQRLGRGNLNRLALLNASYRHAHHLTIEANVEKLSAVASPARLRATVGRDLPSAARS